MKSKVKIKAKVTGGPNVLKKIGNMMNVGPSSKVTKKFGM